MYLIGNGPSKIPTQTVATDLDKSKTNTEQQHTRQSHVFNNQPAHINSHLFYSPVFVPLYLCETSSLCSWMHLNPISYFLKPVKTFDQVWSLIWRTQYLSFFHHILHFIIKETRIIFHKISDHCGKNIKLGKHLQSHLKVANHLNNLIFNMTCVYFHNDRINLFWNFNKWIAFVHIWDLCLPGEWHYKTFICAFDVFLFKFPQSKFKRVH